MQDPARMKAGMGASVGLSAVERPPSGIEQRKPKAEQTESLLESVEKDLEQRFGAMKKRLQEIDATLFRSDEMVKSMESDIEGSKALDEDFQEEQRQLDAYKAEIAEARTEQTRLREKLKILLSVADEGELNKRYAANEVAEEAAVQKASQEARALSLDEVNAKRDEAEKAGDEGMVTHLESEMLDRLDALGPATTIAEQPNAEAAPGSATVEQQAEKATTLSTRERAHQFVRLGTKIGWELEKVGGMTPEIAAMKAERLQMAKDQLAILQKERDGLLAGDPSAHVETMNEVIDGWQKQVASLEASANGAPEAALDSSPEAKLRERAQYFSSLQRSEGFALEDSAGVVTPEVQKLRAEMLQIATEQLAQLRSEPHEPGSESHQELLDGWEQVIVRLKALPSEQTAPAAKMEAPTENLAEAAKPAESPVGKVVEGKPENTSSSTGETGPEQAKNDAENAVLKAHADQPGAEIIATPELLDRQAEFAQVSRNERTNLYDRLILRQKWLQEAAGGAVTDQVKEIHEQLRALAPLIRKDLEGSAMQPENKARALQSWDRKVQSLAQDPVALAETGVSNRSRFTEEIYFMHSLKQSAEEEISRAGGTVTERAKSYLREAIGVYQKRLSQIEAGEAPELDANKDSIKESLKQLRIMLGEEKPQTSEKQSDGEKLSYEGIDAAEGMNEILTETKDIVGEFERRSMEDRFTELNEALSGNKYESRMKEMSASMKGMLRIADEISDRIATARIEFEEEKLTQQEFDQMVKDVGEELATLQRRAESLAEEFESTSAFLGNHLEENGKALARGTEDEVRANLLNQNVALKDLAKSAASKKAKWEELEIYAQGRSASSAESEDVMAKKVAEPEVKEEKAEITEQRAEAIKIVEGVKRRVADAERKWNSIVTTFNEPLQELLDVQVNSPAMSRNMRIPRDAEELSEGLPTFYKGIKDLHVNIGRDLLTEQSNMHDAGQPEDLLASLDRIQTHLSNYERQAAALLDQEAKLNAVGVQLKNRLLKIGDVLQGEYNDVTERVRSEAGALDGQLTGLHEALVAASKSSKGLRQEVIRAAQSLHASLRERSSKTE